MPPFHSTNILMKPFQIICAVVATTILGFAYVWGIAFVVSKIGIESFSPAQLSALRFGILIGVAIVALPLHHLCLKRGVAGDHM